VKLSGYINDPDGELKKTIRNVELLTRNLEGTRQKTDTLLASTTSNINLVTSRATTMLDTTTKKVDSIDVEPILTRVNSALEQIDNKLPPLLEKADVTMVNVSKISQETRLLSEKTFPKIPGIASQVEDVMFSTDRLLNSLQNTWLLRDNSTPATRQDFIRGDSYE